VQTDHLQATGRQSRWMNGMSQKDIKQQMVWQRNLLDFWH
jgi:hypothetical protein